MDVYWAHSIQSWRAFPIDLPAWKQSFLNSRSACHRPLNHNSLNIMYVCIWRHFLQSCANVCMGIIIHSFVYIATEQRRCLQTKAESVSSCSGLVIVPETILANCSHLAFLFFFSPFFPSPPPSPSSLFSLPLPSPILSFDKALLSSLVRPWTCAPLALASWVSGIMGLYQ